MAKSVSELVSVAASPTLGAVPALPLRKYRGPPIGLQNLRGSSCYLNSVLQCLTFTSPLAEYCLRRLHSSTCTLRAAGDCTFCILEERIRESLVLRIPIDAPIKLYRQMTGKSTYFQPGRHEDAHELLRFLIDDCGKALEAEHQPSEVGSQQQTVLDGLFGGALQSHIECPQCHADSTKCEDHRGLKCSSRCQNPQELHMRPLSTCSTSTLTFANSAPWSKHSLVSIFSPEALDGDNKYHCHSCEGLSVHRAPKVLTIQLKRFDPLFGRKLNHHLQFEHRLNISDYMSNKLTNTEYTLYGVIVHHGSSLDFGHYVAYGKVYGRCTRNLGFLLYVKMA